MSYTIANLGNKMVSDDEFYTPPEPIEDLIKMLNIPKDKVIWCPFDTKESNFVKEFKKAGYRVINSHIWEGKDFFTYEPNEHWDLIISNPPFKNKKAYIERAKSFKKEYILLLGSAVAFQNGFANVLNEHELFFIYKPIKFESLNGRDKKFLSMWISNKLKFKIN